MPPRPAECPPSQATVPRPTTVPGPISSSPVDCSSFYTRIRHRVASKDELPSAMTESITLRGDRAELTRLQGFADEFAHKCGLPDDERSRLLIILEELFTNAVAHGRQPYSAAGHITVALGWKVGRLRI